MTAGAAFQKLGASMKEEQEVLMNVADMMIEVFSAESALLKTQKLTELYGEAKAEVYYDITIVYLSDALERINLHGKHAISAFTDGDEQRVMLLGLKRFTKYEVVNTKAIRRKLADILIAENKYSF
jgi:hypothetical protein